MTAGAMGGGPEARSGRDLPVEPVAEAPEMVSIVLRLVAAQGGWVRDSGRAVFAEVLRHVGECDPELGTRLHDGDDRFKPFTCSGLLEEVGERGGLRVELGGAYHIRLTGLTEEVCRAWGQYLVAKPPETLRLRGCEFAVTGALVKESEHRWAGSARYSELLGRALARSAASDGGWTFELATPAAFRTQGMTLPLPLPVLFFGTLADKWNTFSPLKLEANVRRGVEEQVGISSFALGSAPGLHMKQSVQIGAYGQVKFSHLRQNWELRAALLVLAEYARFAGVGIKTTMGMGQCRWQNG